MPNQRTRLEGLSQKAMATEKGRLAAASLLPGTYRRAGFRLDVVSVEAIEGGVAVLARAFVAKGSGGFDAVKRVSLGRWEGGREVFASVPAGRIADGEQVGFGPDGTVDVERFRFFNPPLLVDDPEGDVVREQEDEKGEKSVRRLREDPKEALLQALEHTVSVVAKFGDGKIAPGKVGNTTSTLYSVAGANSPCDGDVVKQGSSWSGVRDAADGDSASATSTSLSVWCDYWSGPVYRVKRPILNFDTSVLGTDTVISAVLSLAALGGAVYDDNSSSISVVAATPASAADVGTADFDQFGTTAFASKTLASWNATENAYNDLTFDAAGIAHLNGSGVTSYGLRNSRDISNTAPTGYNAVSVKSADTSGTSADPKLVVQHYDAASGEVLYDGKSTGYTSSGTSLTVSHVTVGVSRCLLANVWTAGATELVTGVTYGGVAMTQLLKKQRTAGGWCYVYGLLDPAAGANSVVVSTSSAIEMAVLSLSYSNVRQSSLPDASASFEDVSKTSPLSRSVTTSAGRCRVVGFVDFANLALTSDQTYRANSGTSIYAADTGPVDPAGSATLSWTFTGTITDCVTMLVSLAPAVTTIDSSRAAELVGEASSDSSRQSEVSGEDVAVTSRPSEISGQADASGYRAAELHGEASSGASSLAETAGEDSGADSRPCETVGQDSASSSRPAEVDGEADSADARQAEAAGEASATDTVTAEASGYDAAGDGRPSELTGEDQASALRPAEISGVGQAADSLSAEAAGEDAAASERNAEVHGEGEETAARAAEATGEGHASGSRPAEVSGHAASAASVGAELEGIYPVVSAELAAELHGEADASAARAAEAAGEAADGASRGAEARGVATAHGEAHAEVTGASAASDDLLAELIAEWLLAGACGCEIGGLAVPGAVNPVILSTSREAVVLRGGGGR